MWTADGIKSKGSRKVIYSRRQCGFLVPSKNSHLWHNYIKIFLSFELHFCKRKKKGKEKIPLGDAIVFSLEDCFLRKAECLGIGELRPPLPSFLFKNWPDLLELPNFCLFSPCIPWHRREVCHGARLTLTRCCKGAYMGEVQRRGWWPLGQRAVWMWKLNEICKTSCGVLTCWPSLACDSDCFVSTSSCRFEISNCR